MYYEKFIETATDQEVKEAVNDYLRLYPKFNKQQITIEQYMSNLYETKLNEEY